jgi:hypothetical protein
VGKVFAALDPSGFQRTAELSAGVSAQMDCHPVASNKGGYYMIKKHKKTNF